MTSHISANPLTVGILGGGTSGYLAALTLRAFHPGLDITLIESSHIPIIGVGEATTSEIVPFLHRTLGFDPAEFYQKVRPTWKLGIQMIWGPDSEPYFNYPFDRGPLLESYMYEGHSRHFSLLSSLMSRDLAPVVEDEAGTPASLLAETPFAYHLDNKAFVAYLREKAVERGIRHLDVEIQDATLSADGGTIESLRAADGRTLAFDFYIDCSGFRSLLLGRKLKSEFRSYGSSLFTDTAVVASAPARPAIRPYTTAETMNNGWCWHIPTADEEHLGYVFSSAFCSEEEARAELLQKHPEARDLRIVRFRSGRHQDFVKGNVAAIGNSYGFVEPLESTGIFVICRECLIVAENLQGLVSARAETHAFANSSIGEMWDYLRWFLAIHYRFNTRLDTPFWKHCRENVDISGATGHLAEFRQNAPLYLGGPDAGPCGGHNFNEFGFDTLLFGQGVSATLQPATMSRERYFAHTSALQFVVDSACDQRTALAHLAASPGLLSALGRDGTWISMLEESMLTSSSEQDSLNGILTALAGHAEEPAGVVERTPRPAAEPRSKMLLKA